MSTKISDLPVRVTLLNTDLLVIANGAEEMNYKISVEDLKIQLGDLSMADLTTLIDDVGAITYIGKALPGTLTSAPNWKIMRVEYIGGGDLEIKWAGSANFSQIWGNRNSLSYS